MIRMESKVKVKGITGEDISIFMLNCTDDLYRQWWPGTHFAFHTLKRFPNDLGNLVYFDETIGKRRLMFKGVVTANIPGEKLEWQMKKIVKLPARLTLNFIDNTEGVIIFHTLTVGLNGVGKIFDPILSWIFSTSFEKDLEQHVHIEFHKLAEILN